MKIKNATKLGFIEAEKGDGIDISSRMQYHRGTVQKGLSQTLTCCGGNNVGVVVESKANHERERENYKKMTQLGVCFQVNALCLWVLNMPTTRHLQKLG